ncbi:MAG: histidinol-phosphate transaminase [Thiomargarita sp.]|nr:histidinol-phosphate transaminase [Thiomargarita sp.]
MQATDWIRPEIQQLSAYQVPDSSNMIKMDAMENPYPWTDELIEEWLSVLKQEAKLNRYPDSTANELKQQLRKFLQVPVGMDIMLGNGSDELIQMLILAVNQRERLVLVPEPSFIMYRHLAQVVGMPYIGVHLQPDDFSLDIFAMLEAIETYQPALIFLASPNNPTGNLFAEEDVEAVLEVSEGLVVIDEAYAPYVDGTLISKLSECPNLLVMRSISKFGLAGLRLGILVGSSKWIEQIEKIRQPYNINTLTQLSATFALQHYDVFEQQIQQLKTDRKMLFKQLNAINGVQAWKSEANFILFRVENAPTIQSNLKERGILIKSVHDRHPLLENCLQVTVGTADENLQFLGTIKQIL